MTEYEISFASTLSNQPFLVNQTLSSSSMGKNTFMRYSQVVYVATLVILGFCGNILCAIVFCTKSLK